MKHSAPYAVVSALLLNLPVAHAAGLDRSGQSIQAFLQSGHYAEAGYSVLDAEVSGKDLLQNPVDNLAESYGFAHGAVKVQINPEFSFGLLYDQPFGADSLYPTSKSLFSNGVEGTHVEVKTHNLTALFGYQPHANWTIYAGPVYQTVEADISLRGEAYKNTGYNIHVSQEPAWGWAAGVAYQLPEIALKAALTYRSEIEHQAPSVETSDLAKLAQILPADDIRKPLFSQLGRIESKTEAVTPQSVNLDLQTGIAADTLAFAQIRWVHWSQFAVRPALLNQLDQNLIDYSDDQWSANVGLGRKFNDQWSASASLGWDSGAGNPVTTLGPTEGYWNVGLGAQYSPAAHYFIQAGVKYFWLGDADAETSNTVVGHFSDNHAFGYGLKIGYRF